MKTLSKISIAISALVSLFSISGIMASWRFAEEPASPDWTSVTVGVKPFVYTPQEMPDEEVTAVKRLSDILNKSYTTDKVQDSLKYLLEETIQVYWNNDKTEDPFVGSMDATYKEQINELFGDIVQEENVSFILKNQDLNSDGYNEIAMYSTSDDLCNKTSSYDGVVCVYVTVFTPIINIYGQVTGYKQVCESLRGYCYEIYYSPSYRVESFSTDEWRDSVGYTRNFRDVELSESEKLNFDSYHKSYRVNNKNYDTKPMGDDLSTVLRGQF